MSSTIVADVRQQLADPGAALAVLGELEHRRDARERLLPRRHAGDPLAHADRGGQLLAVVLRELRLVVEQVDVRRPARHEQVDHALGLRARSAAPAARRAWPADAIDASSAAKQAARIQAASARAAVPMPGGGPAEELAAGQADRSVASSRFGLHDRSRPFDSIPSSPSRPDSGSCWRPSSRRPARRRRASRLRGDSPTPSSFAAACGIGAVRGQAARSSTPRRHGQLGRLRRPGGGQAEGEGDPRRRSSAGLRSACRSASLRDGLDVGRVVQQDQGLQRRVGRGRGGRCRSRGRGRRRSPAAAAARCASRTCTSCGGRGPCRGSARRTGPSSSCRRAREASSSQSPAG